MGEVIGILASGRGSNFEAILDHIKLGVLRDVKMGILITNKPDAGALKIAKRYGVETAVIEPQQKGEPGRIEFEKEAIEHFKRKGVTLIILAGFMRIVSPYLIRRYRLKMMNIHPSLLPAFPGLRGPNQALEYGAKVAGCTVHYVDEGMDTGPIIQQGAVPLKEGDREHDIAQRILLLREHRLLSKAIQLHADRRLKITGRRVKINYGGGWERKWNARQRKFIRYQKRTHRVRRTFWDD